MEENTPSEEIVEPVVPLTKSYAPSRTSVIIFSVLIAISSYTGYRWYRLEQEFDQMTSSKNLKTGLSQDGSMFTYHWNINGLPAFIYTDNNHDGNYEKGASFNFNGDKIFDLFDDNEDGYSEYTTKYDLSGNVEQELYDMDQDGSFEKTVEYENGLRIESKDLNFDGVHDSIYVYKDGVMINRFARQRLIEFCSTPASDSVSKK